MNGHQYFADLGTGMYLHPWLIDVQIDQMQHRFRYALYRKDWEAAYAILDAVDELIRLAGEADKPVLPCLAS
jgi:hypothetical protein